MKKLFLLTTLMIAFTIILPINVGAVDTTNKSGTTTTQNQNKKTTTSNSNNKTTSQTPTIDMSEYNQSQNCNTLLGNPKDSNSVAWLIDKVLSYATIAGMALVVVLSSFDFLTVIVNGDDDKMAKATRKLFIRLLLAALLFFVPTITNALLGLFGLTSDATCGIQQG